MTLLHTSDKKHLSVGFFGYPNVGKSSIINTLRKKRVCKIVGDQAGTSATVCAHQKNYLAAVSHPITFKPCRE